VARYSALIVPETCNARKASFRTGRRGCSRTAVIRPTFYTQTERRCCPPNTAAQALNISRACASDWKQFTAGCERYQLEPRPASAACPVRALRAWLDTAQITTGPILRRVTRTGAVSSPLTAQSVALIIKKRARAASELTALCCEVDR
jgi:hypothetical protein